MAELTLSATQHHGFPSGRAGVGLNAVGETVLIKLQPYLEMSLLLQRAAADPRVVCPLRQLMGGDEPVLMPEKSKINYKQVLDPSWAQGTAEGEGGAEGRLAASEGGQKGSVARPGEDFGRFPIHNDYAYYRAQRCPPSALTVRAFPGRLICLSVCLFYYYSESFLYGDSVRAPGARNIQTRRFLAHPGSPRSCSTTARRRTAPCGCGPAATATTSSTRATGWACT